jgi:hypothetical protein
MNSNHYHMTTKEFVSEKTGTIDQVSWSAKSHPFKVISVLSFTDGEEIAAVAVDDSMLACVQPGRSGTFTFSDAGGHGALIRLEDAADVASADGRAWRRVAQRSFLVAAALIAPAAYLLGSAALGENLLLGMVAFPIALLAMWFVYVGTCRQRISALVSGSLLSHGLLSSAAQAKQPIV